MNLTGARARYLSAIGAMLPSLALSACKDPAPVQVAMTDSGSSTTTLSTETTPTATPPSVSATATATATASDGPVPSPGLPPRRNMFACPSGTFCTTEGAKVNAKEAAPAPFTKCALNPEHPEDQKNDAGFALRRNVSFSAENTTAERAKTPNACCYTWVIPCPGGRAFRDATGHAAVARTIDRSDWTASLGALAAGDLAPEVRARLADHWTEEAAFEHASIASFAQLTLDLLAVGAPPELLAATQHAALDEIEHARIAFALATAYGGGRSVGPAALAALPGACRSLAEIARTTFIDACVGESVAAAVLAESSREAVDPVLRDVLATMAADEERHAELAWRIVAWALRVGGADVARAVGAAQSDVIEELVSITSDDTRARDNAQRATVLREVVLPCSVALLASASAASSSAGSAHAEPLVRTS